MTSTIRSTVGRVFGYVALMACICLVSGTTAWAQWKFHAAYGCTNLNDEARGGVQPVSAALGGGYVAAGNSYCRAVGGASDIYVVRTTNNGTVLWQNWYEIGGNDSGMDIQEVKNDPLGKGGFIVTGITQNSNSCTKEDIFLLRLDKDGNILWARTYGGSDEDMGWDVLETRDGDFVVTGWTYSFGSGPTSNTPPYVTANNRDGFLMRTSSTGEIRWGRTFGGDRVDYLLGAYEKTNGDIFAAGATESYAPSREVFCVSTSSIGTQGFCFMWGGANIDQANGIFEVVAPAYVGDLLLVGYTESFGAGSADALTLRIPAGGGPASYKVYGTSGWEELTRSVEILSGPWTRHFVASGLSTDPIGGGGFDLLIYKDDIALPAAPPTFAKLYGGPLDEWGLSIAHDPADDGYIAAGYTKSWPLPPTGLMQMYLVKTDNTGSSSCPEHASTGTEVTGQQDIVIFVPHSSRVRTQCDVTASKFAASGGDYPCPPAPIVATRPNQDGEGGLSLIERVPEVMSGKGDALPSVVAITTNAK